MSHKDFLVCGVSGAGARRCKCKVSTVQERLDSVSQLLSPLRLCVLRKPDIDLFFCCGMTVWSFLKANGTSRGLGVQKTNFSKPGT